MMNFLKVLVNVLLGTRSRPLATPADHTADAEIDTSAAEPHLDPSNASSAVLLPPTQTVECGRVDVGGFQLCLYQCGHGGPTVVIDSGAGLGAHDWVSLMPRIAAFTHVCAYDRAALGQSDRSPHPRTPSQMITELRSLLQGAKVMGPYVLVGHSMGAINTQLYAIRHPSEVAGMILVDPTPSSGFHILNDLLTPAEQAQYECLLATFNNNLEGWTVADLEEGCTQVCAGAIPDIPLLVLSATEYMGLLPSRVDPSGAVMRRIVHEQHATMAGRSSQGRHIVVSDSHHGIHHAQPEIIVEAIRQMIDEIRDRGL